MKFHVGLGARQLELYFGKYRKNLRESAVDEKEIEKKTCGLNGKEDRKDKKHVERLDEQGKNSVGN
jgi:hypothetical protein